MPRARRNTNTPQLPFNRKLVLQQWMLGLSGVDSLQALAEHLRDESLEGMDENNIHRFYHAITLHIPVEQRPELTDDVLLEHDQSIVAVTQRLNQRRITRGERPIIWKYFQYLALLFTEIYLDRYFRDPRRLLADLNTRIANFNETLDEADQVGSLDESADAWPQLNKIAFWMATGSGKTLLMHAHILQYRRFLEKHGRQRDLNRIILLTPNEGLSQQHLVEFEKAGIDAEIFNKDGRGLFAGHAVEIIEVTKLKEEMGAKTIAVDAFEGNNLVLVDEGHRGASSGGDGTWMKYRNALCEKGFSFEYSATFGQAVKNNDKLTNLYARSTLLDYSYRWFYGDGFGKDYHILNLESDNDAEWRRNYLTACLLAFYQQQKLYRERRESFRPFNIERPLWVFVGGSVNAVRSENREQVSDVIAILRFLSEYVQNPSVSIERIRRVLNEGLVTTRGSNLFAGRFSYLNASRLTPADMFAEALTLLFNAQGGGALYVDNLKGVAGEIAVRVGENEPFGVINVGDDAKLLKLCEESGINVDEREFFGSLFNQLNDKDSTVNVLIGSKKFTEGWSSWRVSTMGLMNVGRGEGAQIIQLFGRGVRLKGHVMSLKRSARSELPQDVERPKHIETLETLNIFGIRADYMAQFRDFLEEEGLPASEERIQFVLPIVRHLGSRRLKTVRLKEEINGVSTKSGDAFRALGPVTTVIPPDPAREERTYYLQKNQVVLNWYPKVQAMKSEGVAGGEDDSAPNQAFLTERHVAFLDIDRLYFDLERFKTERGWHNLNLTREGCRALLGDGTWYHLLIPESIMAFDSFEKVRVWQELALSLLKKYTERYYAFRKREWELPHLEYADLPADDANFPAVVGENGVEYGYRIIIEQSEAEIVDKLQELKAAIEGGELRSWEFRGLKAIWFGSHVYEPLLYLNGGSIRISPAPLNKGERQFVEDLKAYHDANPQRFAESELYLLRNQSRGRGIGFFEAGNFYPDFIVWQVEATGQRIAFVDPKGIRNLGPTDPKIGFYETVKEIEKRLSDPSVTLESYIVSNTPSHVASKSLGIDKVEMQKRNILFQNEDNDTYIAAMLRTK
jgi:hypothetical protein